MRARVTSETEPLPFRTLLVVWKLTPDLAATSLTDTRRAGRCTLTEALLWPGERSPHWPVFPRPGRLPRRLKRPLPEPSESTEAGAAQADGDESDDPMTPDTEHVLWELLVGETPPD